MLMKSLVTKVTKGKKPVRSETAKIKMSRQMTTDKDGSRESKNGNSAGRSAVETAIDPGDHGDGLGQRHLIVHQKDAQ